MIDKIYTDEISTQIWHKHESTTEVNNYGMRMRCVLPRGVQPRLSKFKLLNLNWR